MEQLELVIKAARSGALATLIQILGDFDLAEEAIQEAIYRACIDWKNKPIPNNPTAWLIQTGRHYAIDQIRHRKVKQHHQEQILQLEQGDENKPEHSGESILHLYDDQLRLIFTCCHPILTIDAQVALTLKTIAGLNNQEIARVYLLTPRAIEQRITRAKKVIREANLIYEVPSDNQIDTRLAAVMKVIYLIYTQAYTTQNGSELLDIPLSETAISLAYILNRLIRSNYEAQGLLALILLQHARAKARISSEGLPIPLLEQNRQLWDPRLINQGLLLVDKCRFHNQLGPYQLQAAISAIHCKSIDAEQTNWQEIINLYARLEHITPGPIIKLNRAIAIAQRDGAKEGLRLISALGNNSKIQNFQYYHSAKGALLEEINEPIGAITAYRQAILLCSNEAEKRYLIQKVEALKKINSS